MVQFFSFLPRIESSLLEPAFLVLGKDYVLLVMGLAHGF